jgi:prepilin-type N-terminal cleavage/methylation domain-containing protein
VIFQNAPSSKTRWVNFQAFSGARGFTLSELLVSLSVLGLIAAFAIPSILAGVANNSKKALLKEAFNFISNGIREGVDMGQLRTTNDLTYFQSKLNATKVCTNATAQGCWTGQEQILARTPQLPLPWNLQRVLLLPILKT